MMPENPIALLDLIGDIFKVQPATTPLTPGSCSPADYLVHTFFEGKWTGRDLATFMPSTDPGTPQGPGRCAADCVLWANRGGGKTFLGAVATLLDLMFKPGIEVRILAGSLQQAARMHEHLRRLCETDALVSFAPTRTARSLTLSNGSRAEILAASETAIRGARVAKLRCDEVDLFKPALWEAAQLTTRAMKLDGPWGDTIRGGIEALSTMHVPLGMMWSIVSGAAPAHLVTVHADPSSHSSPAGRPTASSPRVLFRWGVLDVLETCPAHRDCQTCPLWDDCKGRAKRPETPHAQGARGGHVSIDDAISHKLRIPLARWQSEALCLRPSRSDAVFPEFDERSHLFGDARQPVRCEPACDSAGDEAAGVALYAGMDFGYRSPTTVLWASLADDGVLRVLDCYAQEAQTLERHIVAMAERTAQLTRGGATLRHIAVDPAGHQRSAHTGVSSVTMLRQAGLVVKSRHAPINDGLQRIRAMLEERSRASAAHSAGRSGSETSINDANRSTPDYAGGPLTGPRLLIHRRCTTLIEALHRFHYPADKPHETSPVKDGNDHVIDALRYLVMSLPVAPGGAGDANGARGGRSYL